MRYVIVVGLMLFSTGVQARSVGSVPDVARKRVLAYWAALAGARFDELTRYYAKKVRLRRGSELLGTRFGISPHGRRKAVVVSRDKLIEAYKKLTNGVTRRWTKHLSRVKPDKFTFIRTKEAPMGGRPGDLFVMVATGPGDDSVFYVWREGKDGKWWLVEEQADW